MLPNEVFALACRAYYEKQGLIVDETNGEFAHCPLTRKECDTGYYLLWGHHQHQGLLQSLDLGKCCFFAGHALKWLRECDYFPDNYFELWDIYEKYNGENGKIFHALKNQEGKSVRAVNQAKSWHKKRDKNGKSLHGLKAAEKLHAEKNEEGKSLHGLQFSKKVHEKKNEEGKSLHSLKIHELKDENGRSVHALGTLGKAHEEKDELGRSKLGVRNSNRLNSEKDPQGRSVSAVKGAVNSNSQRWRSTVDGHISTAAGVAKHNKVRGWDPNARVRIS
jgi:hypothetical protein